jgi:hypothetical protein
MPIAAIPFKSPAPFELPPHLLDAIRGMPFGAAAQQVLEIMRDSGCADLLLVAVKDTEGRLTAGPALTYNPGEASIAEAVEAEIDQRRLALDSEAGREDFMGRAVTGGQPLLMMGDVVEGEPDPFPKSFRAYILKGQPKNNLGFLYVFPLTDSAGQTHGAIALHRGLASGPLNHDQPAIVHALVTELGARAGGV